MPSELKPCPFGCGPAEMREWDWPYVRFQVRCPKCKCSQGARKADKAEAIAAWNQRPEPASQADNMEPLGEAFERVWDANTDKLYEFGTQADDALVEKLARIIWSVQYPTGTSWDDWAKHHATNNSAFDGRNWAREHARAILPIIHRERAAAHAAGRAAERAEVAAWLLDWADNRIDQNTFSEARAVLIKAAYAIKRGQHKEQG